MKEIGGYFELELPTRKSGVIGNDWVKLNSGRHALEYILRNISPRPSKIFIPYYTCDVVHEPLSRLDIPYESYHINKNLELAKPIELKQDEYIIVNNYFGIKDSYINSLLNIYGSRMIVDDAQALFHAPLNGMRTFYSPRKFVGVPDGGFAKTFELSTEKLDQDFSTGRALHLLRRIDSGPQSGLEEFRNNDAALSALPIRAMSRLTSKIFQSIDFEYIQAVRRKNFSQLHDALGPDNTLSIPDISSFACPMVYPFLTADSTLRQRLTANKIYTAQYWPINNTTHLSKEELNFMTRLISLPIDQRYGEDEMDYVISLIKS